MFAPNDFSAIVLLRSLDIRNRELWHWMMDGRQWLFCAHRRSLLGTQATIDARSELYLRLEER